MQHLKVAYATFKKILTFYDRKGTSEVPEGYTSKAG